MIGAWVSPLPEPEPTVQLVESESLPVTFETVTVKVCRPVESPL
jgi:hypothetical protein